MASERFEMRIDSDLLERLDQWRQSEGDIPSRAEAVRRLIELGVAQSGSRRVPHISDGEKLIALMLGDLIKKLNIDVDTDVELVQKVIYGGHYWALDWEMPGIFHGHADKESRVSFVVDVLDMWSFMEEAFEELGEEDRKRLVEKAGLSGENVRFPGFDGNNESEYLGIARFFIEDLDRFERFKTGRQTALNSHCPTLQRYSRMLKVFEPIRKALIGRRLSMDELAAILNGEETDFV
jgi:uncharacterized protein YfbU (UPF0304 family)